MTSRLSSTLRPLAVLAISAASLMAADNQQIITLGYATSPILQAIRANHISADGRSLLKQISSSAKALESSEHGAAAESNVKVMLVQRLRGVSAVVADLGEVELSDDDITVIDAANQAGVPVVFENVTGPKMAKVFGIGVDNPLVVAEFDPRHGNGMLNFSVSPKLEEVPGAETPNVEDRDNFSNRLKFAEDIINNRPFAASQKNVAAVLNLGTCPDAPALNSTQCKVWRTSGLARVDFCPNRGFGSPQYTCQYGMGYIDPELEFGIYQVASVKYVRFRSIGGYGIANNLNDINSNTERFPFFSYYKVYMVPSLGGTDFALNNMAPSSQNSSTSISVTTGWNVSASAGADASGANGSVSAGYDTSRATTFDSTDWKVAVSPAPPSVIWAWYLATTKSCDDSAHTLLLSDRLVDKLFHWCLSSAKYTVDKLPDMSMRQYGFSDSQPFGEVVWFGSTSTTFKVTYGADAKVNNAYTTNTGWTWHTTTDTRSTAVLVTVDTSVVQQ